MSTNVLVCRICKFNFNFKETKQRERKREIKRRTFKVMLPPDIAYFISENMNFITFDLKTTGEIINH